MGSSGIVADIVKIGDLTKRLLTAAVVVPVLILCFWEGTWSLLIFVTVVTLVGVHEFFDLQEKKAIPSFRGTGVVAALALNVVAFVFGLQGAAVFLSVLAGLLVLSTLLGPYQDTALQRVAGTLFPQVYIVLLMAHYYFIRQTVMRFDLTPLNIDDGFILIILVVGLTFLSDTGGYLGGKYFGKHLLAPAISPKKTWEGAAGGLLASLLTALLAHVVFQIQTSVFPLLVIACVVQVVGMIGDLAESQLKRSAGVKDTGTLFPGHGGALDRLDSLVFSGPAAYYVILAWNRFGPF